MKILIWLCLIPFMALVDQSADLSKVRKLYSQAAEVRQDAVKLNQLMLQVDTGIALPVMICYKGANEMMQAKYAINPIVKLEKFNKGKNLIEKAFSRDSINLEVRFIRYSIQSNLPALLNYNNEMDADKLFLLDNIGTTKDPELKEMISNYLSAKAVNKTEKLKPQKK